MHMLLVVMTLCAHCRPFHFGRAVLLCRVRYNVCMCESHHSLGLIVDCHSDFQMSHSVVIFDALHTLISLRSD